MSKGLRQGCGLSPTLFKIFLDRVLAGWTKKCRNVGDSTIHTLFFADDQILLAEDRDDLSYMARKLEEVFENSGLKLNMKKSEYLAAEVEEISDLPLENGKMICGVQEYKYPGVIFDKKRSSQKERMEVWDVECKK